MFAATALALCRSGSLIRDRFAGSRTERLSAATRRAFAQTDVRAPQQAAGQQDVDEFEHTDLRKLYRPTNRRLPSQVRQHDSACGVLLTHRATRLNSWDSDDCGRRIENRLSSGLRQSLPMITD